jgi:tRNA(fMet)-specific endonuclease VapC
LTSIDPTQVSTSIISYEEQMRGWLSYTTKARAIEKQVEAYKELKCQLTNYCTIPIIDFDEKAA